MCGLMSHVPVHCTLAQYRNTHTACVWMHVPWPSTGPVPEHPYCMCVGACTLAQYQNTHTACVWMQVPWPNTGTPILQCVGACTLAQYRNTHTACVWMHVPWPSTGTPILHVWVHVPWPSTGTRHPASVPSRQCRHRLPAERLTPMAAVIQDEYKN